MLEPNFHLEICGKILFMKKIPEGTVFDIPYKLIAYVLQGQDNDSYMLYDAPHLTRCSTCGELLKRPHLIPDFKLNKKFDVSSTYDGYTIVSKRFVDEWHHNGGTGLVFNQLPADPDYFTVEANKEVEFDSVRRKTRFEDFKPCCNRFKSIAGATPAIIKNANMTLSKTQAFQTDVLFGSGDEKHPLIIIPTSIGIALKKAKLSGLDFGEVLM